MASDINPSLTPTNNLANFRFWCQKVLPLVYDDSLSYYEVIGKMVVQLNDVIDNVNADTENVLTLKDAFLELQDYVNNFFDDIDQLASYAERAETAKTAANQSAINASESAANASASSLAAMNARDAANSARQAAETSANTASTAADHANIKANEAAQSAITAQTAQASASQSATLAATDRSAAQTAASTATTKANEANASATNAAESATNAEQSKDDAEALVNNVQESLDNIQQNTEDISDLKESLTDRTLYSTTDINEAAKLTKGYAVNSVGRYSVNAKSCMTLTGGRTPFWYAGSTFTAKTGYLFSYAFWKVPITSSVATTNRIAMARDVSAGTVITVPQDCYVIISARNADDSDLPSGTDPVQFMTNALDVNVLYKTIKEEVEVVPAVESYVNRVNDSTSLLTEKLVLSKNVAKNTNYVANYYVDNSTGELVPSTAGVSASDYFLVRPSTTYYMGNSGMKIAFYDFNKTFISGVERVAPNLTVVSPVNACYARMSAASSPSVWNVSEGDSLIDTPYFEPYFAFGEDKYALSPYYKGEYKVAKPDVHEWYESVCLKNDYNAFNFSLGSDTAYTGTQYADMIALYDQLMSDAESGYITKTSIGVGSGTDINGNPYTLYEYAFVPTVHTANNVTKKHPKILIDCCIHGFEKVCAFATFSLLYDVVHNWTKNSFLATLRNFVEIRVVPVVDAWGFDNNTRNNANNVNLNRNFPDENWESGSGINYGGEEPLDQPEAAAIASWLDANSDMLMYFNLHVSGHYYSVGFTDANQNMPFAGITEDNYYLKIYNALSRHIERQSAYLPTEFDTALPLPYGSKIGGILPSTHIGTANQYVCGYKKMALAMTLEGFNMLKDSEETFTITVPTGSIKINAEMIANVIEEILYEFTE